MTGYAWLYRVVLDCLIETWRRESRALRDVRRDMPWPDRSSIQLGLKLVNPATSTSKAANREEVRDRVHRMMELLSDRDQEVLWMRHFDQLSFVDMASVLGIT